MGGGLCRVVGWIGWSTGQGDGLEWVVSWVGWRAELGGSLGIEVGWVGWWDSRSVVGQSPAIVKRSAIKFSYRRVHDIKC